MLAALGERTHVREHNKAARFELLVIPHRGAAYNLARWLTGNEDDAGDVVQEAFLRAFRFFEGFHGGDGRAWLLAIVRNTCLTWLRRNKSGGSSVEFNEEVHATAGGQENVEERLVKN